MANNFPTDGSWFALESIDRTVYRWAKYKPDGARQMGKPGRWQKQVWSGDYMKWENCDVPQGVLCENLTTQGPITAAWEAAQRLENDFPTDKFTQEELNELYPDGIPIVVMKLLFPDKSQELTIGELRQVARALAQGPITAAWESFNTPAPVPHLRVSSEMVNAAWNAGKHRRMTGSPADFRAVLEAALAAASKASGRKPYCIWDVESADAWHSSSREVQNAWDNYVQREVDIWNEREGTYDRGAHLYHQWTPPLTFAQWLAQTYPAPQPREVGELIETKESQP